MLTDPTPVPGWFVVFVLVAIPALAWMIAITQTSQAKLAGLTREAFLQVQENQRLLLEYLELLEKRIK